MTYKIRRYIKVPKNLGLRRTIDVTVGLTALTVCSPLFVLIPTVLLLVNGGPVFYAQTRVGRDGRLFRIYKFRTMKRKAEPYGPELSRPCDPRVTTFGRMLRKCHLDEIPQFWNVLKGDMTIVGYRPERPFYVAKILQRYPEYQEMLAMKPGLVSRGVLDYGYASTIDGLVKRAFMDIAYLSHHTGWTDLKLVGRTFGNIFGGKGL